MDKHGEDGKAPPPDVELDRPLKGNAQQRPENRVAGNRKQNEAEGQKVHLANGARERGTNA